MKQCQEAHRIKTLQKETANGGVWSPSCSTDIAPTSLKLRAISAENRGRFQTENEISECQKKKEIESNQKKDKDRKQ